MLRTTAVRTLFSPQPFGLAGSCIRSPLVGRGGGRAYSRVLGSLALPCARLDSRPVWTSLFGHSAGWTLCLVLLWVRSPFCPDLVSFLPKRFVAYFSVLRIICSHFAVLHRYLLSSYSSFWRILASFLCLVCPYSATNIPSIFCQRILLYSDVFTECIFRLSRIREYCCAGHISLPDVFPPYNSRSRRITCVFVFMHIL